MHFDCVCSEFKKSSLNNDTMQKSIVFFFFFLYIIAVISRFILTMIPGHMSYWNTYF